MYIGVPVRLKQAILVIFIGFLLSSLADARLVSNKFETTNGWQYVAKFCYYPTQNGEANSLYWNIQQPSATASVLIYEEKQESYGKSPWNDIFGDKLNCTEKVSNHADDGYFDLEEYPEHSMKICNNESKWIWVAISDCGSSVMTGSYKFEFINGQDSQLSCEEFGLFYIYVGFLFIHSLLFVLSIYMVKLNGRERIPHMISHAVCYISSMQLISVSLSTIHYWTLSGNGVGMDHIRAFGNLSDSLANLFILWLIFTTSQLWSLSAHGIVLKSSLLTYPSVPKDESNIINGFLLVLAILNSAMFIWNYCWKYTPIVYHFYESYPGITSLTIRSLLAVWLIFRTSIVKFQQLVCQKTAIYAKIIIIYFIWIVSLPLVVMVISLTTYHRRLLFISLASLIINSLAILGLNALSLPLISKKISSISSTNEILLEYDNLNASIIYDQDN